MMTEEDKSGKDYTAISSQLCRPTVKHSGGGVMIWVCFALTESLVKSSVYQSILEPNMTPSFQRLKLIQDNDLKRSSKSTTEKNQGSAMAESKSRPEPAKCLGGA